MNALDLLMKDHEAVQGLFAQFERAGKNARKKRMLFDKIKEELQVHTKIEEEIFYPAVAKMGTGQAEADIEHCLEDHEEVDQVLNSLQSLSPDDSDFDERMTDLIEAVLKHIELEQGEVFAEARKGLGDEKIEELGRDMEQLKRSLKRGKMDESQGMDARE
jgi:iron-sulfur cluster repair protein YtfE (RIC family)